MKIEPNVIWGALFSPFIIKLFLILIPLTLFFRIAGILIERKTRNIRLSEMKSSTLVITVVVLLVITVVFFKVL